MVVDTDLPFDDIEPWDLDEPEIEEPGPPSWRKPVIVVVAVVTALPRWRQVLAMPEVSGGGA